MPKEKDPRLERAGVSGYNQPKRTPSHPTKSHVVVAKEGDKVKTIRFGQQGVSGAGKAPKSEKEKARRKSFKARHAKNIAKGKMSAAYWANKENGMAGLYDNIHAKRKRLQQVEEKMRKPGPKVPRKALNKQLKKREKSNPKAEG